MPSIPVDSGYASQTRSFIFREIGSIKIPKFVRERAFQLEVSLEVIGIANEGYRNYKSYPSHGFFGYAVLVFYDYVTKLIPIQFGRQTLYFERNESAYCVWDSFKTYHFTLYDFYELTDVIGQLASYLGATVTPAPYEAPQWKGFEELPLREVYVRCPFGTTFKIETTWKQAALFTDMEGNDISPESKRDDTEKDDGLPPTGMQPQAAPNPSNPYSGFPPPSSSADMGAWGNSSKLPDPLYPSTSGIDKPNSVNTPETEGSGINRYLKVVGRTRRSQYNGGCATTRIETDYYQVLDDTQIVSLAPRDTPADVGCGVAVYAGWNVQLTGGSPFNIGNSDEAPTLTFERHDSKPPYSQVFV